MGELQQELLDYAKKRYQSERQELLSLIDLKSREIEDFRQTVAALEVRNKQLDQLLDQEQQLRMEDLSKREMELLDFQKRLGNDKSIAHDELKAAQAVIARLTEQNAVYKKEVRQLTEESDKELEAAQKDLASKEMQIENLRQTGQDLERKMAVIEGAAREEKEKLQARVQELDQMFAKEREARKVFELQAKNALSLSTASMLEGRAESGALKNQVTMLSERVRSLEAEKGKIIDDWQVERRKWEELWLRERTVWESQMVQSKESGTRFMKERTQWEGMLRSKEAKEIRLTKMLSSFLTELNRWKDAFHLPAELSIPTGEEETQETETAKPARASAPKKRKWILAFVSFIAVSSIGAALYFKQVSRPMILAQKSVWELSIPTPSGIAMDPKQANVLWITDWKSGEIIQVSRTDPSQQLGRFKPELTFFHPNSIAFSPDGGKLFSLDSVSHKIYVHSAEDPSKILQEIPAPSPASLFLSVVDAQLAVLDTIEKKIYFYAIKDISSKPEIFDLPKEISPAAMSTGKNLWIADAKASQILRFAHRGSSLRPGSEQAWKRSGSPIQLRLGAEFSGLSAISGFLALEATGDLLAVFEGEPGKLVLLQKANIK